MEGEEKPVRIGDRGDGHAVFADGFLCLRIAHGDCQISAGNAFFFHKEQIQTIDPVDLGGEGLRKHIAFFDGERGILGEGRHVRFIVLGKRPLPAEEKDPGKAQ